MRNDRANGATNAITYKKECRKKSAFIKLN